MLSREGPVELTIRPAQPRDLDAVFALLERFATSFTPERAAFDRTCVQLLAHEAAFFGVAESITGITGYALGFVHPTFYANGSVAVLEELMVAEHRRRQGVGRALVQTFERWAEARGAKLVSVSTRRAGEFYERLGYEASATYYRRLM